MGLRTILPLATARRRNPETLTNSILSQSCGHISLTQRDLAIIIRRGTLITVVIHFVQLTGTPVILCNRQNIIIIQIMIITITISKLVMTDFATTKPIIIMVTQIIIITRTITNEMIRIRISLLMTDSATYKLAIIMLIRIIVTITRTITNAMSITIMSLVMTDSATTKSIIIMVTQIIIITQTINNKVIITIIQFKVRKPGFI